MNRLIICDASLNTSPSSDRNQISVRGLYEQQSKLISKIEDVLEGLKTSSSREKPVVPRTLCVSFNFCK